MPREDSRCVGPGHAIGRAKDLVLEDHLQDSRCPLCPEAAARTIQSSPPFRVLKCGGCGLLYVSPVLGPAYLKALHGADYFRSYYGESIEDFYGSRGAKYRSELKTKAARFAALEPYLPASKGRLLDIGTGQGLFLEVARGAGWATSGTELSPGTVEFLRARGHEMRMGLLDELEIPEESFDAVTSWHCLEHSISPLEDLLRARAILKPGGLLAIAVPNGSGFSARLCLLLGKPLISRESFETHFFHFTADTLRRLLDRAGFQVLRIAADPAVPPRPIFRLMDALGTAIWRIAGIPLQEALLAFARRI